MLTQRDGLPGKARGRRRVREASDRIRSSQRGMLWCSGEGETLRLSDTDPSFHAFDGEEEEGAALRDSQEVANRHGEGDSESFTNLCFS